MEKDKRKIAKREYPRGLCEMCVFRYRCDYAKRNANESVLACADTNAMSYIKDPNAKPEKFGTVRAYVARDASGAHRIIAQRDRRKWWFELGRHAETDTAFERALRYGNVLWSEEIRDANKLF